MGLYIDKQTLDDLGIFAQRGKTSIYNLFNQTRTSGAAELLEEWFQYPLSDAKQITERCQMIGYFMDHPMKFPFQATWFDQALFYLDMVDERSRLQLQEKGLLARLQRLLKADVEQEKVKSGILASAEIVRTFIGMLEEARSNNAIAFSNSLSPIEKQLNESLLVDLPNVSDSKKITQEELIRLDNLIRFEERELFLKILQEIYRLDVYLTVANVAKERGFCLPTAEESASETLSYENVYHPLIDGAKGNSLMMDKQKNIVFLTGANMAGKSTFMKSLGISLYLAHVGLPVPAKSMHFAPRDAIYTSINLPDNIQMGYSHYYAEVLRVKRIAQQLVNRKKLFVIFDELFRGTNVKDAYDGTIAITTRLYQHPFCQFVLSTHIIEAGEFLRASYPKIQYRYLPTELKDGKPIYTYALTEGITSDRHGMVIIENEGIIDLLKLPTP
ncbi:DNA mismatch repair protein [Sphingobacterium corticis]|uniref:DNA mismatch repair protein n=1 Tax=Sphingobacterium corticis TaxID=1812823 RepID=A0ABW5NKL2_9SPHI